MQGSRRSAITVLKFVFLALYFLILTAERVISLVICFTNDLSKHDSLDYYMIALTVLGIFGAYIYGAIKFTDALKHSDGDESERRGSVFGDLAVAAGILLLGGMVHTDGSIPVMQFVSYGMILISMALHTVQNVKNTGSAARSWISFSYTVAYSMAIPVVYHTKIELANVFVPLEIIVSAGMVIMFTGMLRRFYNENGENKFFPVWFLFALIGDAAVLALRWQEEINFFVLIFISVTTLLWLIGSILKMERK
ncbi:MAG: hypothetical protein K2N56_08495 [Oscillospiraceae bacterium]|nr:hypothetical protein [Oscillospiraceae bacterium]